MRRSLLLSFAAMGFVCFAYGQSDGFAYAITNLGKENASWNALRKLDFKTGTYSDVLLNGADVKAPVFSAATRKAFTMEPDKRLGNVQAPFATGVAAAAYDKKHNRLYFAPMFIDQLRFVDLRSMKVYCFNDEEFAKTNNVHNDQAKIITRMAIAPDGFGYAISNDGNTFIRFSTGKKNASVEYLGALVDDPSNSGMSIHNSCSAYGGDMVSDDMGNLYIISARNTVFLVNTETRVAKFLGPIKGLEKNFTVNGAVVDADGNLLVSSAVDNSQYYVVNPFNWTASPYKAANGIFRSSDLANSNYLTTRKLPRHNAADLQTLIRAQDKFASLIDVYPNPVIANTIKMQFNKVPKGNYMLELRDILGRTVMQKKIVLNYEMETQELKLEARNAKGIYMIKMFDDTNQSVFTQKLVVQ